VIRPVTTWLGALGHWLLALPRYLFDLTLFIQRALNPWQEGRFLLNKASRRTLTGQLIFSGVDALPVISLLAIASGFAITAPAIMTLQGIGDRSEVVELLVRLMVYELATLLTLVILLVRTGSAIAVDLGGMKLNRELEGLELLGININRFLLAPRLIGVALTQMVLAVYFATLALVSGVLLLGMMNHSGYYSYLTDIALALHPYDLLVFMGKNFLFGLLIAAIACIHALRVQRSPTELPQQTQKALINTLSLVFVLNALFTLLIH